MFCVKKAQNFIAALILIGGQALVAALFTIDKFKNAGFEIQITELDATINAMK